MQSIEVIQETCAVLKKENVDTDQIIPKQFLKRIEKTGFGKFLFYDWRYKADGSLNPDFPLNSEQAKGAGILIAGANFGCGSSREHAPWALKDFGFRAIIAPSFADIFYSNCLKNGIVVISLNEETIAGWMKRSEKERLSLRVDLSSQTVSEDSGESHEFAFDPFWKSMIVNGWDEISYTLQSEDLIANYEKEKEVEKLGIQL
ncbi:3-isopropylmalate dehydratase small subunit [Fictibacillus iocasae]|uniref:3-isopropylmalate dehydratase small subunit n=1 Tax=Fictibacillus iocasae TaxID=2715437 RepID=A0ABW2NNB0_9BACL